MLLHVLHEGVTKDHMNERDSVACALCMAVFQIPLVRSFVPTLVDLDCGESLEKFLLRGHLYLGCFSWHSNNW